MANLRNEIPSDILVVGAGISGIIAAQRYLQAHPTCRLTILEKDQCIGGVFSKRRLYDEFWTQWPVGLAEFSDLAMEWPPEEDCKGDFFKAKYTTKYLERYVDDKIHNGRSLRERVQFGIQVKSIEKVGGKWLVSCTNSSDKPLVFSTEKLMIANGENSSQNMPELPGKEYFEGAVLHSEDFGESTVISSEPIKHISVIGAGKSSADMIYEAVKGGKVVSWIIRSTGTGPGFFAPLDMKSPYKNPVEGAQTRILSSLQPSLLNRDSWWSRFLHSTTYGTGLVKWVFAVVDAEVRKRADYKGRESTKGFEKLEYDTDIFWQNGTGGALHHDDFWDLVAKNVSVYRDDVKSLNGKTLHLKDGTQIPCDAVLCGTGWKPGLKFFSTDLLVKLGLPHLLTDESDETRKRWQSLTVEADEVIAKRFLVLANPPTHSHKQPSTTPYRLYNCMAPLSDDSILFMNHITAGNKMFAAEAQAIWAVAYFDKKIALPSIEAQENQIAMWIAWCRRRYLSSGELGNFATFDAVPYIDKLLNDIGATAHMKGWWRNNFQPVRPGDLGKAWEEYIAKSGDDDAKDFE